MGFAHTLGEFGVVLMLGGNLPGVTRVASIAIFDHVEQLDYGRAHALAGVLVLISFALLLAVHVLNRHTREAAA
jgi:molybdate transport system permease protein